MPRPAMGNHDGAVVSGFFMFIPRQLGKGIYRAIHVLTPA